MSAVGHRLTGDADRTIAEASCRFCESGSTEELYSTSTNRGEVFSFRRCGSCAAVFLHPFPSEDRLAQAYDEGYYGERETKFLPFIEAVVDWYRRIRSRKITRVLPPEGRILDIGCGNGRFLKLVADQGFEAHGMEIPGKAAERAAAIPGIHVSVGSLENVSYQDGFFDAVTMWHVFEHLTEPRPVLDTVSRILKPGGCLFLSLPNVESWQCRIFKGRWFHHDPPRHLFYLGPQDLSGQLERWGLERVNASFVSLEQNPFGIQQSLLNCMQRKRDLLYDILKGNPSARRSHGAFGLTAQTLFFVMTFPLFAVLSLVESAAGKGGTMELVFRKRDRVNGNGE